jgi:hypothetical protein
MLDVVIFWVGFFLGAAFVLCAAADFIEARGVDKYLAKRQADKEWWKANPTGSVTRPDGITEWRFPLPDICPTCGEHR